MSLSDKFARSIRELAETIAEEQDTEQLRELILAINSLLDAIDRQRIKLEGEPPQTH